MDSADALRRFERGCTALTASLEMVALMKRVHDQGGESLLASTLLGAAVRVRETEIGMENVPTWLRDMADTVERVVREEQTRAAGAGARH